MQANAQRGLLWGVAISLLIHLTVLTIQVGGDSFGWRAPTSDAQQDASTRMKARLVPREAPATLLPEVLPRPTEQRASDAAKTTTVTVNASSPIPRAEELDPPIPRVEQPAALPPTPIKPLTPTVEVKPDKPVPSAQPPELVTPAKTEPKAPAPLATTPPPLPVTPPPVAEPVLPKPEVKEVVEAPAKKEPAAPTPPPVAAEPAKSAPAAPVAVTAPVAPLVPVAAPVPSPQIAAPTPPVAAPTPVPATVTPTATAAPAAPAQPVAASVLAQSTPSAASVAPAAAPASAAAPTAASASPSGASAAPGATGAVAPASGATISAGATGRPSASVTLPSPRTGDGLPSGVPGATGNERLPAFNMPPAKPEGFDPYKARSDAARDAARELNSRRSLVPPSVAPSLTQRERLEREIDESFLPLCPLSDAGLFAPSAPGVWTPTPSPVNRDVVAPKNCRPRR